MGPKVGKLRKYNRDCIQKLQLESIVQRKKRNRTLSQKSHISGNLHAGGGGSVTKSCLTLYNTPNM